MNRQFAMGAAAACGLMMMIQDWYGMDGYIQHVRDNWITLPWWVGGCIAVSSVVLGYAEIRKIDRLILLLKHAVNEADGWHDDARSGPIEDDPLIEEARKIVSENK